jgi:trk system potassium uptake protein TrkA
MLGRRPRSSPDNAVLVVGLGRFGSALAETLTDLGHEVLGVDADPRIVQGLADQLTHVVEADSTDIEAMRQLGADEFGRAVVGIGTDLEASILTTSVLVDLKVPDIWAKAITVPHGRILERVGAHHVVYPEHDMGRRVAHLVTGRMIEFVQLDEGFALVELKPPRQIVGRALGDAQVRKRYGITVVCIKPEGGVFTYATQETVPGPNDILVVAGETARVQAFAELR